MPATVTLATTTLTNGIGPTDNTLVLADTSSIFVGYEIFIDSELMKVKTVPSSTTVTVIRGVEGTFAHSHASSALVTIGRPDWFYNFDPSGRPPDAIRVSPHINVQNGQVWLAQGDAQPSGPAGGAYRWWQNVTSTYGQGPLGVRTQTSAPTSST